VTDNSAYGELLILVTDNSVYGELSVQVRACDLIPLKKNRTSQFYFATTFWAV